MRRLLLSFAVLLLLALPVPAAVSIDWVTVGNPVDTADDTGFGAVDDTCKISKFEITNSQYAEVLNAEAAPTRSASTMN